MLCVFGVLKFLSQEQNIHVDHRFCHHHDNRTWKQNNFNNTIIINEYEFVINEFYVNM